MAMDALKGSYLDGLLHGQREISATSVSWLNALRAEALERANALTAPTTSDEDWRFTDLSPLYKTVLRPSSQPAEAAASVIGRIRIWRGRLHITGDGRRAGRLCWPFASQRQPFFSST